MSTLPPCRICGEKASGFHYGVNTCEACKAFFRRSLNKFETYICNRNQLCDLPPGRRNFCAFCRFKKCVSMGMAKTAIKTGRYTHEKKANDIKELKGMKEWSAPSEDQVQPELQERIEILQKEQDDLAERSDCIPLQRTVKRKESEKFGPNKRIKEEEGEFGIPVQDGSFNGVSPVQYGVSSSIVNRQDVLMGSNSADHVTSSLLYSPPSLPAGYGDTIDTSALYTPVPSSSGHENPSPRQFSASNSTDAAVKTSFLMLAASNPPAQYDPEEIAIMERVIKRIFEVHQSNTPYTDEFFATVPDKEKEYLKQREEKQEKFGNAKPMSRAEYLAVYEATGIDVDGRREMLETCMPHIELCIKRYICFVKSIPGFNELTMDDQICLIKMTRFYCWMILSYRSFNHELQLHASYDGKIVSAEDMAKFNDVEMIQALFELQKRIKNLELTKEEACVFAAFCVMSTEHHKLERADVAEKSQELLLKCLLYLFDKIHPEDKMRLTKFIDCFLHMRSVHDENIKAEERFASEWAGIVEFPPVLYEIWSS